MNYIGNIIEESLGDTSVLSRVKVLSTKIEQVTVKHKTSWVKQCTLHKVEVAAAAASAVADLISKTLDSQHAWYADFKNQDSHYIIFRDKIFFISDRQSQEQYDEPKNYGIALGIPEYQVDFHTAVEEWKR